MRLKWSTLIVLVPSLLIPLSLHAEENKEKAQVPDVKEQGKVHLANPCLINPGLPVCKKKQ
jgi:hypothetical protein